MEITRRRIGHQDYYYLKHSFRKDAHVITKEEAITFVQQNLKVEVH